MPIPAEKLIQLTVVLILCLMVAYFLGKVGLAVLASYLAPRGGRHLSKRVRPTLRADWPEKLKLLRDDAAQRLKERRLMTSSGILGAAAATAAHRPAIAIFVSRPKRTVAAFVALLSREGKRGVCVEVRSGSPFSRPPHRLCIEVVDAVETTLASIEGIGTVSRGA